jgi:hypothetical protein
MSAHEDTLLAARFAALAPEPLAGNWDEVLDRAGTAPKGRLRPERSRLLQGRRRRLFVAVAAVALVALMTASAFAVGALIIRPAPLRSDAEYAPERSARDVLLGS